MTTSALSTGATVTVLITCFNRRQTTLAALGRLKGQQLAPGVSVDVVLVDDGSSDGTADAVAKTFPAVRLVPGSGQLYWSAGMALAQAVATGDRYPDYLLWLNDDVVLDPDALARLLGQAADTVHPTVVVGALRDPQCATTTYSGYRRHGRRPTQVHRVEARPVAQHVDTFNGNVVLVPRAVYRAVGGVDPAFRHTLGDLDYGYRVSAAGFASTVAAGHVGTCPRNAPTGTWRDPGLSRSRRLALLRSPKGLPVAPQTRLMRRHAGPCWPFHLAGSYVRPMVQVMLARAA